MIRALVLVIVLPLVAFAEDPSKQPIDPFTRRQAMLKKEIKSFGDESIKEMTLSSVKDKLEKEFKDDGLKFIIREDLFRLRNPEVEAYGQARFRLDMKPNGLTLDEFLTVILADLEAVHVSKPKYIEITTTVSANPLTRQIETLHEKKISSFGDASIKEMSLAALKDKLEREFRWEGLKIVIREDLFRLQYPDKETYILEKFRNDLKPNGMTLHDLLTVALADVNAVYLVRKNYIEITTPQAAVGECWKKRGEMSTEKAMALLRREPLVSLYADAQPLGEVVKAISARYGRPVVIAPGAEYLVVWGDPWERHVSPSWSNVPFSTAVRLLAVEAGLEVKSVGGVVVLAAPTQKKRKK